MKLGLFVEAESAWSGEHGEQPTYISFYHKSFQEFSASYFIQKELEKAANMEAAQQQLFPSGEHIEKHREVVRFTCGRMSDPTPLVQHVYHMYIEEELGEMRRGDAPDIDPSLFESLYRESAVRLPGTPLHNPYINFYDHSIHPIDTSPIYIPSKLYGFDDMRAAVTCDIQHRGGGGNQEEAPGCAIDIYNPDPSVGQSLLTACRTICQHQPVTDLWISELECDDVTEPDVFNMSRNAVSLKLRWCRLPAAVLNHLLHQMSDCTTLHTINLAGTSLAGVTSLNLSNMAASLTHLDLSITEMSPELCESVCTQLPHLVHLEHIHLLGNPVGVHGRHIAESIRSGGPDPPLRELRLWNCEMPVAVCAPLLSALSTCKHLTQLDLAGNKLTGCLPNLVPDPHPGLHSLVELDVDGAALNRDDVQHVTRLIQTNKLPRLSDLNLRSNNLCVMEDVCGRLIEACVTQYHHQGELVLNLRGNNLSEEFVRRWGSHCAGTNIRLWIQQ